MPGSFPQEAIDEALCSGSGVQYGKFRIYEQYGKGLSNKENADFLKHEYGIGSSHPAYGIGVGQSHDGKGMTIDFGDENGQKTQTFLNWTQIAKRIGELIAVDRYFNPREVDVYPTWLEHQQEIRQQNAEEAAAREIMSREPAPAEPTEYTYQYHLGDTVYIGSHAYEVLAFNENTVRLYDTEFPLFNQEFPRDEFDRKIAETPLNEHLRITTESQPEQDIDENADLIKQVRDALDWRGYVVSDELIEEGIKEYDGDLSDISSIITVVADYIESEYLQDDDPAPEPEQTPDESEPTITPAWEQKKKAARVNYFDAFPHVPMSERHNFKITDDNLGHGGAKAKFRANMDAINLLHELEFDGRLATPEEQETLSRYVGWGSLPQAFDPDKADWADEYMELITALSTQEWESARSTTLNAHYTSPIVIKAIYKAIENMGFQTGNILDPGCGIGNFQGLLPDSMSGSKIYGIEIDPITGRIAQQLYQKNSIAIQGYCQCLQGKLKADRKYP